MVIPLGPGKFYGSSLPRPRYYTDIKYNTERVDPPSSFLDPLLSWANESHWSMGGLSFHRVRLQGKIEGNIAKLKAENEKVIRTVKRELSMSPPNAPIAKNRKRFVKLIDEDEDEEEEIQDLRKVETRVTRSLARNLPVAPILKKRKRLVKLIDEEDEEGAGTRGRRRLVRKLGDEFDRVASEDFSKKVVRSGNSEGGLTRSRMMKVAEDLSNVGSRTRGRISEDDGEDVKSAMRVTKGKKKLRKIGEIRTSPRLSKNSGSD